MNLEGRIATDADAAQLAAMNQQLIRDEGHQNAMPLHELEERMTRWLQGEYEVMIFRVDGATVGYGVYKREDDWTYLRQFFVLPEHRRKGIGRAAIQWLVANRWHDAARTRLDVLVGNKAGIAFWRAIGFQDYCLTMEMTC